MKRCLSAWVKLRTIFDVPALTAKIQDLEKISAQPEFWNDQTQAQQTLSKLNDLKAHLQVVLELLESETDEALLQEAQTNITQLTRELDQWELQQLLSGLYDEKGAVLTINAVAGGTDAQDWSEMLLRMYTRW